MKITLVGKPGCTLCDQARVIVAQVCTEAGAKWSEVSVLDDVKLFDAYWEKIPVLLIDGAVHDYWRVDPDRLRAAIVR